MIIVRAQLNDIPSIQAIAKQTWPKTFEAILSPVQIEYMLSWMYSTEALSIAIESENQSFWLFQQDGNSLGFAGIEHLYNKAAATKLHKIYVLPSAQGLQVGKQLLNHVIAESKKAGSTNLLLNVNRFNNAVGFYERFGFSITAEENIDIGNGFLMEDYVMVLSLT